MHNMSNLTSTQISDRLTRLVNTFFLASVAPEFIAGGMDLFNSSDSARVTGHPGMQIDVPVITLDNVYVCSYFWLGILVLSNLMLFGVAAVGVWFRWVNLGPDIFGYVSCSLTRGNEMFAEGNERGSTLDGFERTLIMKDVQVKLGDVRPLENNGLVAFVSTDGTVVGTLKRGRVYL